MHVDGPGDITDSDGGEYDRQDAAVAILNATQLATAIRVDLAASLDAGTALPANDITPEANDLFALLLERGMVDDDLGTFVRIREGGWAALKPAIRASEGIGTFLKPDLVVGMVSELLADSTAARKVGRLVLDDVEEYVPGNDWTELKAVARYADSERIALSPDTVVHIAQLAHANGDVDQKVVLRALATTNPAASVDQIVAVFEHFGPDYDKIRQAEAKLKFDRDDIHDRLLKVLQDANVVSRGGTGRRHYSATVR